MNNTVFYKVRLIDGRTQTPKDLDFHITPSLVFGKSDKVAVTNGYAHGLGIKWGYYSLFVARYVVYDNG